jgi:hypothetical protein
MKEPRMQKKQIESTNEETPRDDNALNEEKETQSPYRWEINTIVVSGQPMTVTFPQEEN